MPWVALPDSLQLCRICGCLYMPIIQDHDLVLFSLFSIKPATLPASMLGDYLTRAFSTPSCFLRLFNLLGNLVSYRSALELVVLGKTANKSAIKLISFSFSFGPTCTLFDLAMSSRLRHDPLKVVAPTHRSGACATWVPLGTH
jgi:hypothetical protein